MKRLAHVGRLCSALRKASIVGTILLCGCGAPTDEETSAELPSNAGPLEVETTSADTGISTCTRSALPQSDSQTALRSPSPPPGTLWVDPIAGIRFRAIPSGTFTMGGPINESNNRRTKVTLTRGYWMSETEITLSQWAIVEKEGTTSNENAAFGFPQRKVSWWQALDYANELSRLTGIEECYEYVETPENGPDENARTVRFVGLGCAGYRLPTEAEWEFAALANEDHLFAGGNNLDAVGWFDSNTRQRGPRKVGGKTPNAWCLFDMTGNLAEWVWNGPGRRPFWFAKDPTGNPMFPAENQNERLLKGCSYWDRESDCVVFGSSSEEADSKGPSVGFRLARSAPIAASDEPDGFPSQ